MERDLEIGSKYCSAAFSSFGIAEIFFKRLLDVGNLKWYRFQSLPYHALVIIYLKVPFFGGVVFSHSELRIVMMFLVMFCTGKMLVMPL